MTNRSVARTLPLPSAVSTPVTGSMGQRTTDAAGGADVPAVRGFIPAVTSAGRIPVRSSEAELMQGRMGMPA
ncbi:hypothetical protein [Streptomyces sp. NPDC086023]|uniref:hypothetical protein n=1 Tax=Streptomyces sp. NPDC086023 TaxID=3365746 RepID=UPI0037D81E93